MYQRINSKGNFKIFWGEWLKKIKISWDVTKAILREKYITLFFKLTKKVASRKKESSKNQWSMVSM